MVTVSVGTARTRGDEAATQIPHHRL
jgi:hypothetical protein